MNKNTKIISKQKPPTDPERVKAFALFFKRYMSISSIITAALPIPITALKFIPTHPSQTKVLSIYTSLFCFLVLAFIFYLRHNIARAMLDKFKGRGFRSIPKKIFYQIYSINSLPFYLICGSIVFLFAYHYYYDTLFQSGAYTRESAWEGSLPPLYNLYLMGLYLGIFITAEAAFILMAIKEYIQDLLSVTDVEIITGIFPEHLTG